MAEADVEVVRQGLAAWSRGDIDAMLSFTSEDFEFRPLPQFFEQPVRGHPAVREFLELWRGSWDTYETDVDELVDLGDGRVLVLCWQSGIGPDSGIDARMDWAQIFEVREGKVVRCSNYVDRAEALRAER
jgi:ketosteroid isomerase-like protein